MIETFRFVFWWRELQTLGTVKQNISSLKDIHKESIVFFPRVVGGSSPEKGNHFILWVLNGKTHIIQVFDSLGIYNSIEDDDMNILCNIFSHIWDLQNWKIEYPIQWKQTDSESCGVFVCTAADVVSRGILMSSEGLSADNLQHLRRYHTSSLMQILRKQMEKVASVPQETELHTEQLTPKDDTVEATERVFENRKTQKSLVQGIDGTECMAAKVMVCLYQESDDLKKKLRDSLKISGIENLLTEDEMKARRLMEQIKKVLRFSLCCRNTSLMIDVLFPEITIKLLQKIEGLNRYEAELVLMRGYFLPSDEDELDEVQTMKKVKRDALK